MLGNKLQFILVLPGKRGFKVRLDPEAPRQSMRSFHWQPKRYCASLVWPPLLLFSNSTLQFVDDAHQTISLIHTGRSPVMVKEQAQKLF